MEYLNKDGTITLDGMDFDVPHDLCPHEISRWTEGKRTKLAGVNICRYFIEGSTHLCWQYTLSMSNYGGCFLDGKPLRGKDVDKAREIFKELKISP